MLLGVHSLLRSHWTWELTDLSRGVDSQQTLAANELMITITSTFTEDVIKHLHMKHDSTLHRNCRKGNNRRKLRFREISQLLCYVVIGAINWNRMHHITLNNMLYVKMNRWISWELANAYYCHAITNVHGSNII